MTRRNYQKEMEKILEGERGRSLFLHSCCAPCSSYVLEYLRSYFQITVFYYNPNISHIPEYVRRVHEQRRLIGILNARGEGYPIRVIEGDHRPQDFYLAVRGLESCPEGGERCFACYRLRLEETAARAAREGADYFATTLTLSPLKNAEKLNEIGQECGGRYGVAWLPSDFKKRGGYQRSVELSREYGLYRQDYCGCEFSRAERDQREKRRERE